MYLHNKLFFIFLLTPLLLFSQVNRNTLYFITIESNNILEKEQQILIDSINSKLSKVDSILISQYEGKKLDNNQKIDFTVKKEYDSYIDITLSGTLDNLLVNWSIYDNVFNKIVIENTLSGKIDKDYSNILGGFWHPIVLDLRHSLFSFASLVEVKIKVLPESKIYRTGEKTILADEKGIATIELEAYSNCKISVIKRGYFPVYREFLVDKNSSLLEIEQKKKFNIEFDIGFYDLTYLDLGFTYYYIPDNAYFKLSTTIFQAQLFIFNATAENYDINESLPNLNTLSFGFGGAIDLSHVKLKIPMGVEFFIRMTSDSSNKIDPIAPWGMEIPIALEYSVHKNVSLYFEYSPLFYFITNQAIFEKYMENVWKSNAILVTEKAAIDLVHANIGIRVKI